MTRTTSLAMTFVFMACVSTLSVASTVQVGGCLNIVNFTTIQAAINAVPSGSTIKVCPGNYPEQLLITKKLTLTGIASGTQDAVVISPPAGGLSVNTSDLRGPVAAQVLVQNATGVLITNLTVDGKGNNYDNDDLRGVLYQDASGTVNHVAVRNEVPGDIPTGIQSGQGIMVETTTSSSAVLTVQNSSVHNYNKNGIVARYTGAVLNATGNYVQGYGPTSVIAQNGIELAFSGAAGIIKGNTVIDNFYIPTDTSSSDILLYDAAESGVVVSGNTAGNSNIAIALVAATPGTYGDNVSVTGNKVFGTSIFDGIDACSNGNTITGNFIFNSAQSGVHLDASCGTTGTSNAVSGNTIEESACAGILDDTGSNTIGTNTYYTVPFTSASSTVGCALPAASPRARTRTKVRP
ncbi:MAG TPA: hypothetical protein VF011_09780 [Terriglobales bacterium]